MKSELQDAHKEAWITFVVSHLVITRLVDKMLTAKGLPGLDVYEVLLTLEDAPDGRLRMSDLADRIMLSRSGITRLVDRLEREGLLARHDCTHDRRATYAAITPEGLALRQKMWPIYRKGIQQHFASKMTTEEASILANVFSRVLEGTPREMLHGMPERCESAV